MKKCTQKMLEKLLFFIVIELKYTEEMLNRCRPSWKNSADFFCFVFLDYN